MSNLALTRYDSMRQAIVEAHSIDDVKEIRDKAEALRQYAKQAGESLENQNMIAEIKLRAERRAGELIGEMPKNTGGWSEKNLRSHDDTARSVPTLSDLGITKMQSSRWQSIASLPEEVFEAEIVEAKAKAMELTSSGMLKVAKDIKQQHQREQKRMAAVSLPPKVYNVIYADPPWQYSNTGVHGAANHHYGTMSIEQLECLLEKIGLNVAKDAVLFLWITNPLMAEAFHLIERWGFSYKSNMVWIKTDLQKPGSGFYVRGRHELLFICTRGNFTPLVDVSPPIGSVVESPIQEHSRKPEIFYDIIERLYPECNYIELFARSQRNGWEGWGNELGKFADEEDKSQRCEIEPQICSEQVSTSL